MERGIADLRSPGLNDGHQLVGDSPATVVTHDGEGDGTIVVDRRNGDETSPRHHTEAHRAWCAEA